MSLLDDVSIVVTPNGYKAGELYAVVPTYAEGSEIIQNVDFSSDTWWQKSSTNVNISNGKGNYTAGTTEYFYKLNILTVGKRYKLVYEITDYTTGYLSAFGGNWSGAQDAVGTYEIYFTCVDDDFGLVGSTFVGSIDNVTVKEVTSSDMDVTRETAATRVDENGLVNYAEVVTGSDIVTDGDFPDGSTAWALNGWTISDNAANGNGLTANLIQSISGSANKNFSLTFTISNYISGNVIPAFVGNSSDSLVYSSNGTFTEVISSGSDIRFVFYGASFNGSISNVSLKEVTRDNVPRIDYTGGGCPHILSEPQRTNLLPYSSDFSEWFSDISGTGTSPVVTLNYATSPSGEQNASRLQLDIGSGTTDNDFSQISELITISNSTVYSRSIYIKSNTGSNQDIVIQTNGEDITTSTITTEWQRFEASPTSSNTSGFFRIRIRGNEGTVKTADILIWGAQLEESYATSYIPTSGSTVTRNQDIFTRDGIGSLINSTEGVLFLEYQSTEDSNLSLISISDGTDGDIVTIGRNANSTNIYAGVRSNSGNSLYYSSSAFANTSDFIKVAVKWKVNDFAVWVNGTEVSTSLSGNAPIGLSEINFYYGNAVHTFFGKVKQLQVYNTALTDEQLLQLTGTSGTDFYESYAEMASALTYTIQ